MSNLLLPTHVANARREALAAENIENTSVHRMDSDDFVTPLDVQDQLDKLHHYISERRKTEEDYHLPTPAGWRVQILVLTIPERSAGGVIVIDDAKEARSIASPQGVVTAVGVDAYTDKDRFSQPWVEVGDRVQIKKYDMTMFQIANGQRLGVMNDTQPVAVIDKGWEVPV